jgi:hypothetical protein
MRPPTGAALSRSKAYKKYCLGEAPLRKSIECKLQPAGKCVVRGSQPVSNAQFERDTALIQMYMDDGALSRRINCALWTNSDAALRKDGPLISALHHALLRRFNEQDNVVTSGKVYRWMQLAAEQLAVYKPGLRFLWPNFASTTENPKYRRAGNVVFVIELGREHVVALRVWAIAPCTTWLCEREVLFAPYSGFEVIARHETRNVTRPLTRIVLRALPVADVESCGR